MEILSKETIALLGSEAVRKAIDEMLKENGAEKLVVTVPRRKDAANTEEPKDMRVILRRRTA